MKTRRAFIQTGAVALCGLAAAPALAKPRKPKDADWTETFDVIVIGSGFAGLAAALEAKEKGASVMLRSWRACRLLRAEPSAWPCSKKWA